MNRFHQFDKECFDKSFNFEISGAHSYPLTYGVKDKTEDKGYRVETVYVKTYFEALSCLEMLDRKGVLYDGYTITFDGEKML